MYALIPIGKTELNFLHFNYRVKDLQEEIEKRTSYLGKFRKGESAEHLLDLVAMTKDEENLLIPFAQDAMGEVFDSLRMGVVNMPFHSCEWKDLKVIDESINPVIGFKDLEVKFLRYSNTQTKILVSGGFVIEPELDPSKYGIEIEVDVEFNTMYHMLDDDTIQTITPRSTTFQLTHKDIQFDGSVCTFNDVEVPIELSSAGVVTSAETIVDVTRVSYVDNTLKSYNLKETFLFIGDVILHEDEYYELINGVDINHIDLSTDTIKLNLYDANDGIHYYVHIPRSINSNLIAPLDTAIKEALINKIIFKWLLLSYPKEAEAYGLLDQKNTSLVYSRCNIFNVTCNRKPRIL